MNSAKLQDIRLIHRNLFFYLYQFGCPVMSSSLQPHKLQYARPPCPLPTARVYPNPCPLSQWCHPMISSSVVPFSSCPSIFPSISVFSNESALCIRGPKYGSFSFNISHENWTIKKAECQRIDSFKLWCWRTLESPLDCKEIKPVNPDPELISAWEGLMLKLMLQ